MKVLSLIIPIFTLLMYPSTASAHCTNFSAIATITKAEKNSPNRQLIIVSLAGGTAPYRYQGYLNGIPIRGATGNSISPDREGHYTFEITDNNGCVTQTDYIAYSHTPNLIGFLSNHHIVQFILMTFCSVVAFILLFVSFSSSISLLN